MVMNKYVLGTDVHMMLMTKQVVDEQHTFEQIALGCQHMRWLTRAGNAFTGLFGRTFPFGKNGKMAAPWVSSSSLRPAWQESSQRCQSFASCCHMPAGDK